MRLCPAHPHPSLQLRAHGKRRPTSQPTNGRTREKTLASRATGPYPLPPPPTQLPPDPPHLSSTQLQPSLCN